MSGTRMALTHVTIVPLLKPSEMLKSEFGGRGGHPPTGLESFVPPPPSMDSPSLSLAFTWRRRMRATFLMCGRVRLFAIGCAREMRSFCKSLGETWGGIAVAYTLHV